MIFKLDWLSFYYQIIALYIFWLQVIFLIVSFSYVFKEPFILHFLQAMYSSLLPIFTLSC